MAEKETTSNSPELIRFRNAVAEICVDVANGLDPSRGMAKVMGVIGIKAPNFQRSSPVPQPPVPKVITVGRNLREIVSLLRTEEEADKLGLLPVFKEAAKWLAALTQLAKEEAAAKKDVVEKKKEEKKKVVPSSKKRKNRRKRKK